MLHAYVHRRWQISGGYPGAAARPSSGNRRAWIPAAYLANLPAAWHKVTPEQRNELARALFVQARINDERPAAIEPQAVFAPILPAGLSTRGRKF